VMPEAAAEPPPRYSSSSRRRTSRHAMNTLCSVDKTPPSVAAWRRWRMPCISSIDRRMCSKSAALTAGRQQPQS
jgi:hypothetical protein